MFIQAKRTGSWKLHLLVVIIMLLYMASAGHNTYIKSTYVYLVNMIDLEQKLPFH